MCKKEVSVEVEIEPITPVENREFDGVKDKSQNVGIFYKPIELRNRKKLEELLQNVLA